MKFNIYTLGCKVNTYETNVMRDSLKNKGYIEVSIEEKADISIINTCTVTNTADNKSLRTVKHAIKENEKAIIVVVGCSAQNKKESFQNVDGVDIVIGNVGKASIADYIEEYINTKKISIDIYDMMKQTFEPMILNNFNKTRAFVKIQDGCNNYCSYCVIPFVRGSVRSKLKEDVLSEVNSLIKNGHKEIVLTGIHTGNYGVEFKDYDFACLLNDLVKIEGLERLRISSIEATEINDRVLELIKSNSILVDHMHIPIQSGSNTVLKRMNRKYTKEQFIKKIDELRKIRPFISITTDVIVGFPGETKEEFEETLETIKTIRFSKIHVFPYSKRDKTKAADMENQVDTIIKKERTKQIINLSECLEKEYMSKFINQEITFIPEMFKDNYIIGHSGNYLQIKTIGKKEEINKDIKVKLTTMEYPNLIGCKVDAN